MFDTDELMEMIERQLETNKNKSLFASKENVLTLSDETNALLLENTEMIHKIISENNKELDKLISYISKRIIEVFEEVNQYMLFNEKDKLLLKNIYYNFLLKIEKEYTKNNLITKEKLDEIYQEHYDNLKKFLEVTNGKEMFQKYEFSLSIPDVVCEQYSPEFQLEILNIDTEDFIEPVLDIGCGKDFRLVKYLRALGIEAYGIDRFDIQESDYIYNKNWMEYEYGKSKWGTVISHMAFSNHFVHHNFKNDGKHEEFFRKFLQILDSIKTGGAFIYAPKLLFIEEMLSEAASEKYLIVENDLSTKIVKI